MIEMKTENIENPLEEWLTSKKPSSRRVYHYKIKEAFSYISKEPIPKDKKELNTWLEKTAKDIYESYRNAEDKDDWAKSMGRIVNQWINERLEKGENPNSIRTSMNTFRSFCSEICIELKKVQPLKTKVAIGEHKFTTNDLRKMFQCGDTFEKAMLSTAVSLGWAINDFLKLTREHIELIVNRAISENMNFIDFDYNRGKTGEQVYGILTSESIEWLKKWLDYTQGFNSKWLWAKPNGSCYSDTGINNILRDLIKKSGITTSGTVRFHLIRKFTFETLLNNGLNEYQAKFVVGKSIPSTDSTYLLSLKTDTLEKYKLAYPSMSLIKTEANGKIESMKLYIENLEKEIGQHKERIDHLHELVNKMEKTSTYLETRFTQQETIIGKQQEALAELQKGLRELLKKQGIIKQS